jgi:hypothetical protein
MFSPKEGESISSLIISPPLALTMKRKESPAPSSGKRAPAKKKGTGAPVVINITEEEEAQEVASAPRTQNAAAEPRPSWGSGKSAGRNYIQDFLGEEVFVKGKRPAGKFGGNAIFEDSMQLLRTFRLEPPNPESNRRAQWAKKNGKPVPSLEELEPLRNVYQLMDSVKRGADYYLTEGTATTFVMAFDKARHVPMTKGEEQTERDAKENLLKTVESNERPTLKQVLRDGVEHAQRRPYLHPLLGFPWDYDHAMEDRHGTRMEVLANCCYHWLLPHAKRAEQLIAQDNLVRYDRQRLYQASVDFVMSVNDPGLPSTVNVPEASADEQAGNAELLRSLGVKLPLGKKLVLDGHCLDYARMRALGVESIEERRAAFGDVHEFCAQCQPRFNDSPDQLSEAEMREEDEMDALQQKHLDEAFSREVLYDTPLVLSSELRSGVLPVTRLYLEDRLRNQLGEADFTIFFLYEQLCRIDHEEGIPRTSPVLEIHSIDTDLLYLSLVYMEKMRARAHYHASVSGRGGLTASQMPDTQELESTVDLTPLPGEYATKIYIKYSNHNWILRYTAPREDFEDWIDVGAAYSSLLFNYGGEEDEDATSDVPTYPILDLMACLFCGGGDFMLSFPRMPPQHFFNAWWGHRKYIGHLVKYRYPRHQHVEVDADASCAP